MNVPDRHNPKLQKLMAVINADEDLYGLWIAANVNAIERLGMTDHGPVHVKIVMNIAVRMLRLLVDAGVEPVGGDALRHGAPRTPRSWWRWRRCSTTWACRSTAPTTRLLASSSRRTSSEAAPPRALRRAHTPPSSAPRCSTPSSRTAPGGKPLTLEAGVVRIADALDMAKGRSPHPLRRRLALHPLRLGPGHRGASTSRRATDGPIRRRGRHVQLGGALPARPAPAGEAQGERA